MIINWFKPSVGGDINQSIRKLWRNTKEHRKVICVGGKGFFLVKDCGRRSTVRHGIRGVGGQSSPCKKEQIEHVQSVTVNIYIGQMLAKCF